MDAIRQWVSDFVNILTRGQCCGWNNVLDVLIVAVFIYYVLVLIRGTRAVQLLIGVLVLVLIYWIATLLRLTLTTLLLQALFAVALVALVVVFQPEPQRAPLRDETSRGALDQRADRRDRHRRLRGDAGDLPRRERAHHRWSRRGAHAARPFVAAPKPHPAAAFPSPGVLASARRTQPP